MCTLKIFAALAFLQVSLAGADGKCAKPDNNDDCTALRDLFHATNGTAPGLFGGWCNSDGWLSGKSYCTWYGVTCDANGRVSKLDMNDGRGCLLPGSTGNSLVGPLPESIGLLTAMSTLNLGGNSGLGGALPDTIGQLKVLTTLDLGACNFNVIPDSIGELKALTTLDLAFNGITSLPDSFGQLKALTTLALDNNHFVGPIPPCIGNLTALTDLRLSGCLFSGAIPDWIGQLKGLTHLDLSGMKLTGALPESMSQLKRLAELYLGKNQLTTIPDWIGQLTNLDTLNLESNQLTGPVPDSIGQLTKMNVLDLHDNQLTGKFNTKICNLLSTKTLDICLMNNNSFSSPLPKCAEANPGGYLTPYKNACIQYGEDGGVCPPSDTIEDLTLISPEISTLATTLKAADLADTLSAKGPFTLFAPTNKAFAALPKGLLANLLKPVNKAQLAKVLTYHVVSGDLHYTDFNDKEIIKTMEGKDLTVSIFGNDPIGRVISLEYINNGKINNAKITGFETIAANGIVHTIDGVLLPDDSSGLGEATTLK